MLRLSVHGFCCLLLCRVLSSSGDEVEVPCVHLQSCVLPCVFEAGPGPIINWFKKPEQNTVYSINDGQLQFQFQEEEYRGRTFLSVEELSRGNASLLITEVRVHDEGTYECVTNLRGNRDPTLSSSITVRVRAPVLQVSVRPVGQQILCRSEKIYPRPTLVWTPSVEHDIRVSESEQGLFSVFSSVTLSDFGNTYICNISTKHSWRSATYWENSQISFSDAEVTVPCRVPKAEVKTLLWRFNCETILTRTGSEVVYSEFWKPFVVRDTESNSLVLKNLTQHQQGLYSCVVSTETEELIVNTKLIQELPKEFSSVLIIVVLILMALLMGAVGYIIILKRLKQSLITGRRTQ